MNTYNSPIFLFFIILIAIIFLGAFPASAAIYSITGEEIESGSLTEYIRSDETLVRGDLQVRLSSSGIPIAVPVI